MFYILWIISSIIAIVANYLILSLGNQDFISLTTFFIIPIGGFGVGALSSCGRYFADVKFSCKKAKNKAVHIILSSLIIVIGFVGVHYLVYTSTYLDSNMDINYSFNGEHISNYTFDGSEEPINFVTYMEDSISNSSRTMRRKGSSERIDLGSNATWNWICFISSFMGYMLGAFTVAIESETKMLKKEPEAEL
ncbi:hypothetical protein [Tepidibacter mesophilus]|uniref:hypothetical protein n=1 Tax=Tepidibacter mesophilus TaxID=655607 RepID=UPI000C079112|nr:hypothetical protein [Tepidibacter mesophilus]